MAEVNIRIMRDENGVPFYPLAHVEAVEGLDEDELLARVAELEAIVVSLQTQINNL